MSEHVYLLTIGLPFGTILLVFGMKYVSAMLQARARLANDGAYRAIAEKSLAVQAQTDATLSSIQFALSELRSRLAAIERVLKEVE
jgi:hypothetical protein